MTRGVVFCGPSLSPELVRGIVPEAEARPPAGCGDVYRAARDEPDFIALVDGYFDHRLSVWHKEILWALDRGILVYGAASMGAIRAAELSSYGMVGVGWVFEQFQSGGLEDDDEVAVVHEAATEGYRARSDAMVNLRQTLALAVAREALSEAACERLLGALKQQFYPGRSLSALRRLAEASMDAASAAKLDEWLRLNGVFDQKQSDARALLRRMRFDIDAGVLDRPAGPACWTFEPTNAWQALLDDIASTDARSVVAADARVEAPEAQAPGAAVDDELETLVADLRARAPSSYPALVFDAMVRACAVALGEAREVRLEPALVQRESERFRSERSLFSIDDTVAWLARANMDLAQFSALIHDSVLAAQLSSEVRRAIASQLRLLLRSIGTGAPR